MFLGGDEEDDAVSVEGKPHLDYRPLPVRTTQGGKGQDNQLATNGLFAFSQEWCSVDGSTSLSTDTRSALVTENF